MRRSVIILVILILVTAAFGTSSLLQDIFSSAADAVNSYITIHPVAGVVMFILLAAFSAMLSLFTSIPTLPFAVVVWGKMLTFTFLLIGWIIGAIVSYAIGRYGLHFIFRRLLPIGKIESYRKKLSEHSQFILVVLFRLALPAEVTGLVLGSLRYNFIKYMLASVISEVPFAVVSVYAGDSFAFSDPWWLAMWIAIGSTIFVSAAFIFAKIIKDERNNF